MGLVERHGSTADLTHWQGSIPVNYLYTTGRAGEKFFKGLLDGELRAAKCPACGVVYLPPRIYCERCFKRLEENYIKVPPRGDVFTFTLCHRRMDGSRSDQTIIMAMVRVDHTDGGIVHYLGEVAPEEVYIGMPVQAVFQPKKERKGSILDIKYFRPRKERG
jgi:hypothetical protein